MAKHGSLDALDARAASQARQAASAAPGRGASADVGGCEPRRPPRAQEEARLLRAAGKKRKAGLAQGGSGAAREERVLSRVLAEHRGGAGSMGMGDGPPLRRLGAAAEEELM